MATGGDFKPSFGGTRDFLPGVCRLMGVTLETHMYSVSSFSFLSYLLRIWNWSKTGSPLRSISSVFHVYRACAEEMMQIWSIFKMSNYDHSLGAFGQSWGLHRNDLKPCMVVGVTGTFQPELTPEMVIILRNFDPNLSNVVIFHKTFLDRVFLVSG